MLDERAGLPSSNVTDAGCLDVEGGLWLPLTDGLARVEVHSPLQRFDSSHGLHGMVLAVVRHGGVLYAGTGQGIFRLEPGTGAHPPRFAALAGTLICCHALVPAGERLFGATCDGLCEIDPSGTLTFHDPPLPGEDLLVARDGGRLYLATRGEGVHSFALGPGEPLHLGRLEGTGPFVHRLIEDDGGRLWAGTGLPGGPHFLERLTPDAVGGAAWTARRYGSAEGLAEAVVPHPFLWRGQVCVGTDGGFAAYDPRADRFHAVAPLRDLLDGGRGTVQHLSLIHI